MNQATLIALTACAGIAAGAGGSYLFVNQSSPPTREDVLAAIDADPALCPVPTVQAPSQVEATLAVRDMRIQSSPFVGPDSDPEMSVALGDCNENSSGPGVTCVTTVRYNPQANPSQWIVSFARDADGNWVATRQE